MLAPTPFCKKNMQNIMNNNISENGFWAMLHSIFPTVEYEEKQMNSSCFWEMLGNCQFVWHLRSSTNKQCCKTSRLV